MGPLERKTQMGVPHNFFYLPPTPSPGPAGSHRLGVQAWGPTETARRALPGDTATGSSVGTVV